ncbi:MAG: hypothetical protein HKN71_01245 [Gemmatimonadetes bacterium]|nr:hypothetical protein [Gemmatimonadota bacterium]
MNLRFRTLLPLLALLPMAAPASAQSSVTLDEDWMEAFEWREIGPANMSGRVTDVEGLPSPSKTFYVAAAAGGIWKTTNNGTTFQPLFQDERVVALGDLAIAPSDTLQIWAGTGEEDSRNSISPGGGIYKSVDGGITWELKGLEGTEHIGRILVHPTDPNTVWVAALGPLWREGGDRGLYKTTDGGDTWRQVASVSDRAGFVDLTMHPDDPNVLMATSWERIRGPYFLQSGGPGSGIWRSTDAGETWAEVTGAGLPETEMGRIGIDYAPSDGDVVYALIEAAAPAEGEDRLSGLYRSDDGGTTWERRNAYNSRPFYYSQVAVDPADADRVYFSTFEFSTDGGATHAPAGREVHVDFHAYWIDPADPDRMVVGNDGGIAISFDRGGNYWFPNHMGAMGQFYNISVDMGTPYRVCGGLQDNYSWCGPSRKTNGAITNHDWFRVSGGDGFGTQQDPRDPDIVYSTSQGGNMGRSNLATGERTSLGRPNWRNAYRVIQDSIAVLWPDSTQPMPSQHRTRIQALQARASADSTALDMRYNWNTPFFLSPHDPDVVYAAGNRVLKSTDRGDNLIPISPDLSRADADKIEISTTTTGGVTPDVTGAEVFATVVSLNESPVRAGLLYAGTDDGNVWMSPDDGGQWIDLTDRFDGQVPDGTYVSRIEPSHHDADRVYISFDNHRRGDFTPYVFVSDDGGESFRSIASDLPTGKPDFVHVVREDLVNPNLLFVGTDVGLYASLDRGGAWQRFMNGFPTVPVHDLVIHPRDGELVAGTHGRSIWITDIRPLQQLDGVMMASDAYLFAPRPAHHIGMRATGGEFTAQAYWESGSPANGAKIQYWIGDDVDGDVSIEIHDVAGNVMRTLDGQNRPGIHDVNWNLRGESMALPLSPSERRDSIATATRLAAVADSLEGEGHDREDIDRVVERLSASSGGFGGFGGFGGGGGSVGIADFQERPAEGNARSTLPEAGEDEDEPNLQQIITQAVRGEQPRRRRFGGGAGLFSRRTQAAPVAQPGIYTVVLRVGDAEYRQPLSVALGSSAPDVIR